MSIGFAAGGGRIKDCKRGSAVFGRAPFQSVEV